MKLCSCLYVGSRPWLQVCAVVIWCCASSSLHAQSEVHQTGWYQYFGEHPVADHWSVHAEAQIRREKVITAWEQLLLRPGLTYRFNPHVTTTLGYTYFRTFNYKTAISASREHRIYEELKLKHNWKTIDIENRFRLEQRFIKMESNPKLGFETAHRFRHRFQVRVPLKARSVDESKLYLSFYNELFITLQNKSAEAVDQNRSYGALGFNFSKHNQLEVGYLYRFFPQPLLPAQQEHSFQVSFYSSVPFLR